MSKLFRNLKQSVNKSAVVAFVIFLLCIAIIFYEWIFLQAKHFASFYYIYEGDKKFKIERLQDAIDFYNKALKLYPGHTKAQYNLGNIYLAYEDYNSAVLCYEKALCYKPDYISARINLAIVFTNEFHDYNRALKEYERAIALKPRIITIPYFYNNKDYVNTGMAVAHYNAGLIYYKKALGFEPENMKRRKNLVKAIENFENSLKFNGENSKTHYNLALAYHKLGFLTKAMRSYCDASIYAPLSYDTHYNLGILLLQIKEYELALEELKKAKMLVTLISTSSRDKHLKAVLQKYKVPQEDIYKSFEMLSSVNRDDYFKKLIKDYEISLKEIEALEKLITDRDVSYKESYITGTMVDAYCQHETKKIAEIFKDDEEPIKISYEKGKVKITDELEEIIEKDFKYCSCKKLVESR